MIPFNPLLRLRTLVAAAVTGIAICAVPFSAYAQPCTTTPCYNGGGVEAGLGNAQVVGGISDQGIRDIILDVLFAVLAFMALAAVVVIVISGMYLVLSLGDESARERAKKVLLYTTAGLLLIALAAAIVTLIVNATGNAALFGSIPDLGTGVDIRITVLNILRVILSFMALAAVVVIVIAGIILVTSLGEETARDRAKKIIWYAVLGLFVILFATAIVSFIVEVTTSAST